MFSFENLDGFHWGDDFLAKTPKKEMVDNLDFIKMKILCSLRDTIKRMRR